MRGWFGIARHRGDETCALNDSLALLKTVIGISNSRFDSFESVFEEEFIITAGVISPIDTLVRCICNDREGILVTRSLYAEFSTCVQMISRGRVSIVRDGHEDSVDNVFDAEANINAYEKAIKEHIEKSIKFRAAIVSKPIN